MKELLFEVGTEEIPARLLEGARGQLGERVAAGLAAAGLAHEDVRTWATPRRLAVAARVADRQPDRRDEVLGPPARVAFDAEGRPTKAAEGFAQRQGVPLEALERRQTDRGEYVGVTVATAGQPATALLPALLEEAVAGLTWPKAMRWGQGGVAFIRPVHWLVALLGGEVLPVRFAGVEAGDASRGHRFHAPEPFAVRDAASWLDGLRARKVEPDPAARRALIAARARELAAAVGGVPVVPEALLEEVAGLVEWPVPLLGSFDADYLALPAQVLTTPMTVHQRYFAVRDADGGLTRHFVMVAGTEPDDPAVVIAGNGRVLHARLSDARFFFLQDGARPLEAYVAALAERRFLEGLGTMEDKARRLQSLAGRLAGELAPGDTQAAAWARRAGWLAKADLATAMVGEFPELQGEMGRDYARLAGEPEEVARALEEHYLPKGAGDALPGTTVARAVALADRLDSLAGCFALGLEPSGNADPYALRRQALGVVRILEEAAPHPGLRRALTLAAEGYGDALPGDREDVVARLLGFVRGRMKSALAQEFPADLAEAALESGFDDPADVRGRLEALHALKRTEGWDALAAAVKRVARIVGDHAAGPLDRDALDEAASRALYDAWRGVQEAASHDLDAGRYGQALERLITLKPAIDRFFDEVLVMSEDPAERARRLSLLARIHALFRRLASFDRVST